MPTNGMTIDSLNTVSSLTAQDKVPVWDNESSGEPTRKITAQNMANSVKTLGSLVNTTEMNDAIAQSTETLQGEIDTLSGNIFKPVSNGNITQNHAYLLFMHESTIADAYFSVLYDPSENNGVQDFGIILNNGISMFVCSATLVNESGTIKLANARRVSIEETGINDWSVSIRFIRQIA